MKSTDSIVEAASAVLSKAEVYVCRSLALDLRYAQCVGGSLWAFGVNHSGGIDGFRRIISDSQPSVQVPVWMGGGYSGTKRVCFVLFCFVCLLGWLLGWIGLGLV